MIFYQYLFGKSSRKGLWLVFFSDEIYVILWSRCAGVTVIYVSPSPEVPQMSRTSHEPRTFFVTRSFPTIWANHSTFFTVRREFNPKGTGELKLARKYRLESGKQGHRQQVIHRGSKIKNFNWEFHRLYVLYFCHDHTGLLQSRFLCRHATLLPTWWGALRDVTYKGCVAD